MSYNPRAWGGASLWRFTVSVLVANINARLIAVRDAVNSEFTV